MTLRLVLVSLCLAPFARAQGQPCLAVEGERILARDLAPALPSFANIPPDTPLAIGPQPGVQRIFHYAELASLAKRYSVELAAPVDLCVERKMETLDRARVLEAMHEALDLPDARIDIVETSAFPVPRGRMEFRREGLHAPALPSSRTPVEWRGSIIYGENRRFAIWARVMVSANLPHVVAAQNLKRGEPIGPNQVRVESVETFPGIGDAAKSLDQVVGQIPWRNVAEGTELHLGQLTAPLDISRGDTVEVEVRSGLAHLSLMAKAESDGRTGDLISMRNPSSNRLFQARVNGKGRAFVDAGLAPASRAEGN